MDSHMHAAFAAAGAMAACCLTLRRISQFLSPRLCKAFTSLTHTEKEEWHTRWSSIFHAAVVSYLCAHLLIFTGAFADSAHASTPSPLRTSLASHVAIGSSLGYFVVDLAIMALTPGLAGPEMFVHHGVALLSFYTCFMERQAHMYVMAMLLTEVTTPFMNLRWLLEKAGLKATPAYMYNGVAIVLLWALFRVALFVPFALHVASHWAIIATALKPYAITVLIGVPLLLGMLNAFWFAKIVKGAAKLLLGNGAAAQESSKQAHHHQQKHQVMSAGKIKQGSSPVVVVQAYAGGRRHNHSD